MFCDADDDVSQQCCIFPPFFTRQVAKECGAFKAVTSYGNQNNYTTFIRLPLSLCEHWKCVLDKYDLLSADELLDDDKYFSHLDRWVDLNTKFKIVIMNAKVHCKNLFRPSLPLMVCQFFEFHGCIRNFVVTDCPATIPSKECEELKAFYDECREFFI